MGKWVVLGKGPLDLHTGERENTNKHSPINPNPQSRSEESTTTENRSRPDSGSLQGPKTRREKVRDLTGERQERKSKRPGGPGVKSRELLDNSHASLDASFQGVS